MQGATLLLAEFDDMVQLGHQAIEARTERTNNLECLHKELSIPASVLL
jgi:hypothetical protein